MAKKAKKKAADAFYAQALSQAEQVELRQAWDVEGLDEEIALLRLRLKQMLSEHPENMPLLLRAIELLVKAVGTRYRLSKDAKENLTDAVTGVLKEVGVAMLPEAITHFLG
jgi:hypothetical protein